MIRGSKEPKTRWSLNIDLSLNDVKNQLLHFPVKLLNLTFAMATLSSCSTDVAASLCTFAPTCAHRQP